MNKVTVSQVVWSIVILIVLYMTWIAVLDMIGQDDVEKRIHELLSADPEVVK